MLLTRVTDPPVLEVAINEAVLRRPVGGKRVITGQLRRLSEASELPNVSIRMMPFAVGLHHGIMSGPFVILTFPRNGNSQETEPPTVYAESLTGALYLDKPREIDRYTAAFTNIWESSLDETAYQQLMPGAARE